MTNLAKKVMKRRLDLGLSQADLAKKAGVSQVTIFKIESGETKETRKIKQIAAALNMTISELVNDPVDHIQNYSRAKTIFNTNFLPFVPNQGNFSQISWSKLRRFLFLDHLEAEKISMDIKLEELKRPYNEKCYLITLDTDDFKSSNLNHGDHLLINPDLQADEKCTLLIEIKPGEKITLAEHTLLGNKAFLRILEGDFPQIIATDIDYTVLGVVIAVVPKLRNL